MAKPTRATRLARFLFNLVELLLALAAIGLVGENLSSFRDETLLAATGFLLLLAVGWVLRDKPGLVLRANLVALALIGLLGELAVRQLPAVRESQHHSRLPGGLMFEEESGLHFRWKPGGHVSYPDITVSSQGLLDHEYPVPKPEGTYRIVCLGDSTTTLSGSFQCLYPKVLERLLAETPPTPERSYEVLNAGTPGYNAAQEALFLEKIVLPLEPDLVILGYCLNDPFQRPSFWYRSRSQLLRLVGHTIEQLRYPQEYAVEPLHAGPGWQAVVLPAYERMAGLASEHGFRLVGFTMPLFEPEMPALPGLYQQVREMMQGHGVEYIEVAERVPPAEWPRFAGADTMHHNCEFHAWLAGELRRALWE